MQGKWEYAFFSLEGESHWVRFSHDQGQTMVDEAKAYFNRGLKERDSDPFNLHIDIRPISSMWVFHFLGDRGWELVATAGLPGTNWWDWVFRRPQAG